MYAIIFKKVDYIFGGYNMELSYDLKENQEIYKNNSDFILQNRYYFSSVISGGSIFMDKISEGFWADLTGKSRWSAMTYVGTDFWVEEKYDDGDSGLTGAVVGGALLGVGGAIIGGAGTRAKRKLLKLKLHFQSQKNPNNEIIIDMVRVAGGIDTNTMRYNNIIKTTQQIMEYLNVL